MESLAAVTHGELTARGNKEVGPGQQVNERIAGVGERGREQCPCPDRQARQAERARFRERDTGDGERRGDRVREDPDVDGSHAVVRQIGFALDNSGPGLGLILPALDGLPEIHLRDDVREIPEIGRADADEVLET